jgi:hypothetical protein
VELVEIVQRTDGRRVQVCPATISRRADARYPPKWATTRPIGSSSESTMSSSIASSLVAAQPPRRVAGRLDVALG